MTDFATSPLMQQANRQEIDVNVFISLHEKSFMDISVVLFMIVLATLGCEGIYFLQN